MEIGERTKLLALNDDLIKWSGREAEERQKYAKAEYELGIILASKQFEEISKSASFKNKVTELLKEKNPVHEELWKNLCLGEQKYKAAESMQKAIESKINTVKFINRVII